MMMIIFYYFKNTQNDCTMKLRTRDILASISALILSHLLYNYEHGSESLNASIDLAFYTEYKPHISLEQELYDSAGRRVSSSNIHDNDKNRVRIPIAKPVPFDIDGDGVVDAIVAPSLDENSNDYMKQKKNDHSNKNRFIAEKEHEEWIVRVLDLKPLQHGPTSVEIPIYPDIISQSENKGSKNNVPIKIITGQIRPNQNHDQLHHDNGKEEEEECFDSNMKKDNGRSQHLQRYYFCGQTWNEANKKCTTHCPSGSNEDCPMGEQCYANSSCDIINLNRNKMNTFYNNTGHDLMEKMVKSPHGGLASTVTVWSDGEITLHAVTTDLLPNRKAMKKSKLELRQIWTINPFPKGAHNIHIKGDSSHPYIEFEEIDLILEHNVSFTKYGSVFLAASFYSSMQNQKDKKVLHKLYLSIDALSGHSIWSHHHSDDNQIMDSSQNNTYQSSQADDHDNVDKEVIKQEQNDVISERGVIKDCQAIFPRSIMNAFPYAYYRQQDTNIFVTHLYCREKEQSSQQYMTDYSTSDHHRQSNVAIIHNHRGIDVMTLKDGYHLCHSSLDPNIVHADITNQGNIDHLQVISDNVEGQVQANDPLDLYKRAARVNCHATLSSGRDTRHKLIHMNLCLGSVQNRNPRSGKERIDTLKHIGIDAAKPLLLESLYVRSGNKTRDIVFALNHGSLQRYDASGSLLWSSNYDNIPKWDHEYKHSNGFLGRIDIRQKYQSAALIRPIIVMGDQTIAIISSGAGKVLATATLPQLATAGDPILVDFDGDGTTDILVTTKDALWGYRVQVHGSSKLIRFAVAILLFWFGVVLIVRVSRPYSKRSRASDAEL
jgi:hypothetical protein